MRIGRTVAVLALTVMTLQSLPLMGWAQEAVEPAAGQTGEQIPASAEDQVPPSQQDLQLERDQRVEAPKAAPLTTSEAIARVQRAGLMDGFPDGKFHPERTMTRAQLASILNRAFKLSEREPAAVADITLKDVPSRYWAFKDIDSVITRGVMRGYREGYFYPEQRVSRAEALAILAQAYGVYQFDEAAVEAILSNYPDSAQVPDWARKALATSLKYGFADVGPSANIRPLQPMTRGDMAYALSQYLQRLSEAEQPALR